MTFDPPSRVQIAAPAILLLTVFFGCAGDFPVNLAHNTSLGSALVPGKSNDENVRASMGAPAEIADELNGEKVWFYPRRGPDARQTYAVRIGADRIVRAVEPRLTPENVARVMPVKMTEKDVRLLLGPPNSIEFWARLNRNIWDYKMAEGDVAAGAWKVLSVQFSPDGIVREVRYLDDSVVSGNRI